MEQEINRLIVEDALQSRHAARERHARPPASRSSAGEAEQKNRRRTTRTSKGRAEVKTPFRALFELSPDASLLFVAGVISSYRSQFAEAFDVGLGRQVFRAVTLLFPHLASVADMAGRLAGSRAIDSRELGRLLLGLMLFTLGALSLGAWRFEQKDF